MNKSDFLARKAASYKILIIFLFALFMCCCGGNRPFVFTSGTQMADLYMQGQITDQNDNRWEIWIVPGICPMLEYSKDSWKETGEILEEYTKKDFWEDCAQWNSDSLKFARDSFTEYLIEGIGEDYIQASHNISANVREAPFGWIPRIVGNALWGYFFIPTLRLATAPVGIAGGVIGSIVFPVGKTIIPIPLAVGYGSINGILVPVSGMIAHQFIYIFAISNREPSPEHDGRFGLYIVNKSHDLPTPEVIIKGEPIEINKATPHQQKSLLPKPPVKNIVLGYDKEDLQRLAAEYIALRQLTDVYLQWQEQLQSSQFSIHVNEGSIFNSSRRFTQQTYQYYQREFAKDFQAMWIERRKDLAKTKRLTITAEEAFADFCKNIVERIGFEEQD